VIIVVDNDSEALSLLSDTLRRFGYEVLAVSNGEDALAAAEDDRPELVLIETNLPGTSGYAVCRALKDRYGSRLPVFFVSGDRTEPFDRVGGLLVGADDYLVKPFDPYEVIARMQRFVSPSPSYGSESVTRWNLTKREQEVMDLLAQGLTETEIAERLAIAPKTVATHIQRILSKLGVRNRAQAVAVAHLSSAKAQQAKPAG
jgi:DNA-binding NarL/FixJ family response regulator